MSWKKKKSEKKKKRKGEKPLENQPTGSPRSVQQAAQLAPARASPFSLWLASRPTSFFHRQLGPARQRALSFFLNASRKGRNTWKESRFS